ncbi:MAG TPA: hypothetical protein VGI03_05575 [Verrucomicrobiae bacterium]|jgi:hypothetical protein
MTFENLLSKQLRKAANLRDKIGELEVELSHVLGSSASTPVEKIPVKGTRRKMSAAAKKKIAASAKARWAKAKAAGKNSL